MGNLIDGATLQTAVHLFAENCVSCHGADGSGTGIAPALNDPTVSEKTSDEITRVITFGISGTLMAGWDNALTADEMNALASLIQRWDEVPFGTIPAPDMPIPVTEESLALGSQLYSTNCSRCHGPEGQGTPRAPSLNVKSFLTDTSDQAIQQIISLGVPGTAMPSWGDRMSDADIQSIVGFIRQWETTAPEVAQIVRPGGGGPPWMRNDTNDFGLLPLTNTTDTIAVDPVQQMTPQVATQIVFDWRVLLSLGAILSLAFTLISTGLKSLQRVPRETD
jgi:mono/diheme cytochrome c family protein